MLQSAGTYPTTANVKYASALQAGSLFVVCEVDCAVATVSTVMIWYHIMCGQFQHDSIRYHSIVLVR
mgnify:CR=1 FL=1